MKMKNVLKKFQILLLSVFLLLGSSSVIAKEQSYNIVNNKYVLSNYCFPGSDLIHPIQDYQSQNNETTIDLPDNTEKSSNWAGYIVTPASESDSYTSISGSWTVPSISSNNENTVAAQWIGLGGIDSSDLLQMGTMEELENGQPVAVVFWEQLPDVAQNIMTIPINSTISVNIYNSSGYTWNLTFTVTTPSAEVKTQTISTTLDSSYAEGIGTSAEWISEDPSDVYGQLVPLANTDVVKYESAKVNGNSLSDSSNTICPVAMESSSGNIVIYPSSLGVDGESFTTTTAVSNGNSNNRPDNNQNYVPNFRHRFNNTPPGQRRIDNLSGRFHFQKSP
ncbi:G1 family glutamic endopeptidase [Clostridium sp. BJN0013]|uniref:G1 family glutamic endopeptidase n=1 Tax=Clostridium sp. BJN0013 TaxID=3236840 RepID=UPI0034C67008